MPRLPASRSPAPRTPAPRTPAPRTVRRYANRKLYDSAERRYVTLQQLAQLVARGHDVRVLDQATGADLTNLTLVQALVEAVRDGAARIPREALRQLIRITAAPASEATHWPEPGDTAARAAQETERLVGRLLGAGSLSLDDAFALRHGLSEIVERRVHEARAGIEARVREWLARGEAAAGRSLGALGGRLRRSARTTKARTSGSRRPARARTRSGG